MFVPSCELGEFSFSIRSVTLAICSFMYLKSHFLLQLVQGRLHVHHPWAPMVQMPREMEWFLAEPEQQVEALEIQMDMSVIPPHLAEDTLGDRVWISGVGCSIVRKLRWEASCSREGWEFTFWK